jgi:hypothetical protein
MVKLNPTLFALPHNSEEVIERLLGALKCWRSFTIAIDGRSGLGKSTFARYLAFRLEMPLLHLDEYKTGEGIFAHHETLFVQINRHLDKDRPIIVEGICVGKIMKDHGIKVDCLVRLQYLGFVGPDEMKRKSSGRASNETHGRCRPPVSTRTPR